MSTPAEILVILHNAVETSATVVSVTHDDVMITYQSLADIMTAIKYYENLVAAENGTGAGRVRVVNWGRGRLS